MKKKISILGIILLTAAFLRFYNLMHDAPFFFNPDERNMASAIAQFRLPTNLSEIPMCIFQELITHNTSTSLSASPQPTTNNCNLNPHFFAYGQFPLYLAYASDQVIQSFWQIPALVGTRPESARMTSFPSAIFYLRFWSALSSTFAVLLVYLITKGSFLNNHYDYLGLRPLQGKPFVAHLQMKKCTNYFGVRPNVIPNSFQHLMRIPKQVRDDKNTIALYAALMAAFTPGLIQSAHFGTTESLLTFFFLSSIYLSMKLLHVRNVSYPGYIRYIFFLSLSIGLALGAKLTGIFFLVPPFISSIVRTIELRKKQRKNMTQLFSIFYLLFFVLIGSIVFFILSSPYNIKEPEHFLSAVFGYEKDVATGAYEAFYTRQFVDTLPFVFQAEKIFPYALGWPIFILGILGFLFMTLKQILQTILIILQRHHISNIKYKKHILKIKTIDIFTISSVSFIFYFSFLIFFLPNVFLFAKWTRFMTPILPFFSIFAGYFLYILVSSRPSLRDLSLIRNSVSDKLRDSSTSLRYARNDKINKLGYRAIGLLVFISFLPGLMFMSIYTHKDTRVQASEWIYQNIPDNSYILSETANVVDIPLHISSYDREPTTYNLNVISFDFYHLDENPRLFIDLTAHLEKSSYIFIPSRRIFANYPRFPQKYPLVAKYYDLLFSGALGFEKVAEISSFPQLSIGNYSRLSGILDTVIPIKSVTASGQFTIPDENAEETFTVFDHPVIRIYRKINPLTIEQYKSLLQI